MEDPRVATSPREPPTRRLEKIVGNDPARRHGRETPRPQGVRCAADDEAADLVTREARVAVDEPRLRRHCVGRIRDDQVEALAVDRVEEASLA